MSQQAVPTDRKYTKSHEWAKLEGDTVVMGITAFAAEQLTDITFVELPSEGTPVKAGEAFGEIESVKSAGELYSPINGEVILANEALNNEPGLINTDAFEGGWIIKIRPSDISELDALLDADVYQQEMD